MSEFPVTITRRVGQRTNDETIKKQVLKIIGRALAGNRGNGWEYSVGLRAPRKDENGLWVFERKVVFKKTSGHKGNAEKQFRSICKFLIKAGQSASFAQYPWLVTGSGIKPLYDELVDEGKVAPFASDEKPVIKNVVKNLGEINTNLGDHFNHIFGRNDQIKIVHSALLAAKETDFQSRFHCVLEGPPACGKSEILTAVGKMLGKENQAFLKWDATSTTKAGAERILLESDYIPPVLIMEEIEKTDESSLRWLLGILDHRAEIKKVNFNIGQRARNAKLLCLATVNDIELFKRVMSGALYSRFAHEIHCPRPDRHTMQKILEREVTRVNGKTEWIEPTLKFCMEEEGIDDPRKIIPICLCGRDDLLDGSYQQAIRNTKPPKTKES
ncbi:MAG: ATP-binding protein [Crenarchaeota archaeon]|nr:MAG: ATP-binding protein [Thermoproteota archaeon]